MGDGIMSEFCLHMNCVQNGFESKSKMVLANLYDNTIPPENITKFQMLRHLEGSQLFLNVTNIRGNTNSPATEWWSYFTFAGRCVSKISRCTVGDVGCAERFAYQRLFPGPFQNLSLEAEQRIHNMPMSLLHLIKTAPHSTITMSRRISAAFHIRREFMHFENGFDANDPSFLQEAYKWSNGSEAQMVYAEFLNRFLIDLPVLAALNDGVVTSATIFVYICSDNNHIKRALAEKINQATRNLSLMVQVMYLDSPLTHNSKNRLIIINGTVQRNSLVDISFDWYCMSLSNYLYSWRADGRGGSTLVGSAGRISGNLNTTKVTVPLGLGGIFSKRFHFVKSRRGKYRWEQESGYTTIDIYENVTELD